MDLRCYELRSAASLDRGFVRGRGEQRALVEREPLGGHAAGAERGRAAALLGEQLGAQRRVGEHRASELDGGALVRAHLARADHLAVGGDVGGDHDDVARDRLEDGERLAVPRGPVQVDGRLARGAAAPRSRDSQPVTGIPASRSGAGAVVAVSRRRSRRRARRARAARGCARSPPAGAARRCGRAATTRARRASSGRSADAVVELGDAVADDRDARRVQRRRAPARASASETAPTSAHAARDERTRPRAPRRRSRGPRRCARTRSRAACRSAGRRAGARARRRRPRTRSAGARRRAGARATRRRSARAAASCDAGERRAHGSGTSSTPAVSAQVGRRLAAGRRTRA